MIDPIDSLRRPKGRNRTAPWPPVGVSASRRRRDKNRNQLPGTAAGLYPSVCSSPRDRLSWDGMSLLPFRKWYPDKESNNHPWNPFPVQAAGVGGLEKARSGKRFVCFFEEGAGRPLVLPCWNVTLHLSMVMGKNVSP